MVAKWGIHVFLLIVSSMIGIAQMKAQLIRIEASNTPSYYHYANDPWRMGTALIFREPAKDLRFSPEAVLDSAEFMRLSNALWDAFPFCEYYTAHADGSLYNVRISTGPSTPLTTTWTYGMLSEEKFEPMVQLIFRFIVPEGQDPRLLYFDEVKVVTAREAMEQVDHNAIVEGFQREKEELEQLPPAPPPPPPSPDWDIRKVLGCDR